MTLPRNPSAGRERPKIREVPTGEIPRKRANPERPDAPKRRARTSNSNKTAAQVPGKRRKAAVKTADTPQARERFAKFDIPFFTIVMVLLVFGIIMMFSASYAYALDEYGDSYFFIKRQLRFAGIGVCAMIILTFVDYRLLMHKKIVTLGAICALGLMLAVRIMGTTLGGSERWLVLFGIQFQPSELLKLAVIVIMGFYIHTYHERLKNFKIGFMPLAVCLGIACLVTILQPHLSGTIIIFIIGLTLMYISGCKLSHILLMCAVAAFAAFVFINYMKASGISYFDGRILSWQNPEADISDKTYQTYHSLITIGSGGLLGNGLGNSRQKFGYLPASHNDFIFSVICEELGFVGAVLVILLFVIFIARGFYIASKARDRFGMMLAVGITVELGIQALLNIAVTTNTVPNTGISLPFFSYGGTALIMQLAQMGILLNVSRKAAV